MTNAVTAVGAVRSQTPLRKPSPSDTSSARSVVGACGTGFVVFAVPHRGGFEGPDPERARVVLRYGCPVVSGTGSFARPRLLHVAPDSVIDLVSTSLGGQIAREDPAPDGFTESVASVITSTSGSQVLVKAGPVGDGYGEAVKVGAELAAVIGDLGPPLHSALDADGWSAAIYKAVPGSAILDWREEDLEQLNGLSHRLQARMDPNPLQNTESYAGAFAPLLGTWDSLLDSNSPSATTVAHVSDLPLPYGLSVEMLAELESDWFSALEPGAALQHGDIRRDNVVREPSGRLWLVDWTHRWLAPGWADWVRLAPDVAASGFNPETLLRHSAWMDADHHSVNVMLTGLAGRCWRDGHRPNVAGLPQLRPMQLLQGDMAMRWLATRNR